MVLLADAALDDALVGGLELVEGRLLLLLVRLLLVGHKLHPDLFRHHRRLGIRA